MVDYNRARATATRNIRSAGKPAVLVVPGEQTGDPWNPTAGDPVEHNVFIVELQYTVQERQASLIGDTDVKLLMACEDANGDPVPEPSNGHQVRYGGKTVEIVKVNPLSPGEVVVMYEVQARA